MTADSKRVQAVFLTTVGYVDLAERTTILDRECSGNAELKRRVEALLLAHDEPDSVLKLSRTELDDWSPSIGAGPAADISLAQTQLPSGDTVATVHPLHQAPSPFAEGPGTQIGPYKLLQRIGEGGMGSVYMAEQEKPIHRRVALKIIKPGMDSAQVVARFEAERQALAMMDHQNIAKVFDAGTTANGRPYFVMELVHGIPITDYCDQGQLTLRERLELFIGVCQAIQHAHQKGIIHRDIKPTNILVTMYDGKPEPKVIDFGIAKATEQRLTEGTMFTQFGSIIGTLEYMSPEQAEMSALGVDTRSDIYSLGVLLYELLTGSTPLEKSRLLGVAYELILKRIKEEEPQKPSNRLSSSGERRVTLASQRKTEPTKLSKLVRGELDWIVMKSLEKDRTRRYESASDFARDVRHFLDGDHVEACPPSTSYRLRRLARKHRAALASVSTIAALLVLGAVLSVWQAIRATRAEVQATSHARRAIVAEGHTRNERDRAIEAEARAKVEGENAKRSAAEANAVVDFFKDHVLAAARPEGQGGGLGKDVTLRDAVDAAEPEIARSFHDKPTVEAYVRDSLGITYRYLGEPALAVRQQERALELRIAQRGPDHPETLDSQNNLALAHKDAGRLDRAIPLFEQTLAARTSKLGPDHPDTLKTENDLALAYRDAAQLDRAILLFERTLAARTSKLGADHPDTLTTQNDLALTYRDAGQVDRAILLFEQTLAARASRIGADHPETLLTQHNLAMAYREAGRWDQAIPLFERTLAAQKVRLGADHPYTLLTQNNLAPAYQAVGQVDRAITLLEQTLAARTTKLGDDHPSTLTTQNNLALAYQAAGHLDRAIPLFERTLAARTSKHGADHARTLTTRYDLAVAYESRGDFARAEAMLRDVLAVRKTKLSADPLDVAQTLSALGATLLEQQKWPEAEPLLRESLAIWESKRPDDWNRFDTQSRLGESLLGQKNYPAAEPLLLSGYDGMKLRASKIPAPIKGRLSRAGERVVRLYDAWGKPEKAREWREKLMAVVETGRESGIFVPSLDFVGCIP